jgi:hypothetical protein
MVSQVCGLCWRAAYRGMNPAKVEMSREDNYQLKIGVVTN